MHSFSTEFGGRTLTIETGKIAKQANGAVLVRYGETAVVVAVTGTDTPREGVDFFPLTVDFEEKMYAVGKIPGGFLRREGRPAETAILTSRLIDRPIRPMFPDGYHNDVQIVATAVSVDPDNAPDIPAMIGASCALSISDIPFEGPIAGVRVGLIDGQFIVQPTVEQAKVSELNLAVAGTKDAILMVEAGAKEVSEEVMLDAIWFAHGEIKKLVEFQEKIQAEVGKPKMDFEVYTPPAELAQEIEAYGEPKIHDALMDPDKLHRDKMVSEAKEEILAHFTELYPDNEIDIAHVVAKLVKRVFRHIITVDKIRPDGRALDEVRPISCEVGLLARPHGCSLFTRGQTQVLTIATLGSIRDSQLLDGIDEKGDITAEAKNAVNDLLHHSFRPEFLNRLDEIVFYKPLTKDNITHIIDLLVAELNRRLEDKQLKVALTPAAKQHIIDSAYDPAFGARPLRRFVQHSVETLISRKIIADEVQGGDTLTVDCRDGELTVESKSVLTGEVVNP